MMRGWLIILLMALTGWARADAIAVIVHPSNPSAKLDKDEVAYLFLRKARAFPGGVFARPLNLPDDAALRIRFERDVLRKDPTQMRAYWSRLVFTGRGKPPRAVASVRDMKQLVATDPTAIGYIDAASVDATVRVVYRLE